MSSRQLTVAEKEAARKRADLFAQICEMGNGPDKYELMKGSLRQLERRYALIVATEARGQLDASARATLLRIAGAANLFESSGGEPVTLAQFISLCVNEHHEADHPSYEGDRIAMEMDVDNVIHTEFKNFVRRILDNGN